MTNIMVTSVGGGVGQSIVKSFQGTAYTVIGVDSEVLGTGLYAVPKAYRVPYASDPGYIQSLLTICQSERCALIFPGIDAELPELSRASHRFLEIGTLPIVSRPEVIEACDDKLAINRFLVDHGFSAPLTLGLSTDVVKSLAFPLILKPRKGGVCSEGVFLVSNQKELNFRLGTLPVDNYVAQEYIAGDEYTCGSITVDGCCRGVIVMKRILRDGDTYKAFVLNDSHIQAHIKDAADALKPY